MNDRHYECFEKIKDFFDRLELAEKMRRAVEKRSVKLSISCEDVSSSLLATRVCMANLERQVYGIMEREANGIEITAMGGMGEEAEAALNTLKSDLWDFMRQGKEPPAIRTRKALSEKHANMIDDLVEDILERPTTICAATIDRIGKELMAACMEGGVEFVTTIITMKGPDINKSCDMLKRAADTITRIREERGS